MLHKTDMKMARVLSFPNTNKKSVLRYGPVVNLTGALLASQDLYVTRCILIIDLCLEIWEGSGNAYIMPKTDSHCPLILLISDNAMIFRLYIHIPLNVGWLIFR